MSFVETHNYLPLNLLDCLRSKHKRKQGEPTAEQAAQSVPTTMINENLIQMRLLSF